MTITSKNIQNMPEARLSDGERDLLHHLVVALRGLQYGSVVLTVHDGQLVEILKTEKIRMRTPKPRT